MVDFEQRFRTAFESMKFLLLIIPPLLALLHLCYYLPLRDGWILLQHSLLPSYFLHPHWWASKNRSSYNLHLGLSHRSNPLHLATVQLSPMRPRPIQIHSPSLFLTSPSSSPILPNPKPYACWGRWLFLEACLPLLETPLGPSSFFLTEWESNERARTPLVGTPVPTASSGSWPPPQPGIIPLNCHP